MQWPLSMLERLGSTVNITRKSYKRDLLPRSRGLRLEVRDLLKKHQGVRGILTKQTRPDQILAEGKPELSDITKEMDNLIRFQE